MATVTVNVGADAPRDTVAFTYDVVSPSTGVKISTNFFPAAGIAASETAPTVLQRPSWARPAKPITYDPAGTFSIVPG